jgi:CRP-like cAMP-binding protein
VIRASLARHPLFAGLDGAVLDRILASSAIVHLDRDELLYRAGAPADRVFAGVEGAVQIEYPEPGEERGYVAAMLAAPFFLGECQVLHGRPWSGTACALAPTVAVGIGGPLLERTIAEHPSFALLAYREITLRFLRAIDAWKQQPTRTPAQSVARYLLGCDRILTGHLEIRQVDLGRATALRRETVNRLLKAWEGDGVLAIDPKGVTVRDRARLEAVLHPADAGGFVQSIDLGAPRIE